MTSFGELDRLASSELHDRAVDLAKQRHDIRFFWQLFASIPEARAIAGEVEGGQADIQHASSWLLDFRRAFLVFTTNAGTSYDAPTPFGFAVNPAGPNRSPVLTSAGQARATRSTPARRAGFTLSRVATTAGY